MTDRPRQFMLSWIRDHGEAMPQPPPANYATYSIPELWFYDQYRIASRRSGYTWLDRAGFQDAVRAVFPLAQIENFGRGPEYINIAFMGTVS